MFDIIKGYFPAIFDVDLRCLQLEWPMNDMHMSREKIFQMARSEAEQIKPTDFGQNSHHDFFYMISSREDNFVGGLWLNSGLNELTLKRIGKIDILCEGVYVCSEDADEWLPKHLKVFSGIINFRASVLDLPLSREQVIKNEKIRKLRLEIANHSSKIIEDTCRDGNPSFSPINSNTLGCDTLANPIPVANQRLL